MKELGRTNFRGRICKFVKLSPHDLDGLIIDLAYQRAEVPKAVRAIAQALPHLKIPLHPIFISQRKWDHDTMAVVDGGQRTRGARDKREPLFGWLVPMNSLEEEAETFGRESETTRLNPNTRLKGMALKSPGVALLKRLNDAPHSPLHNHVSFKNTRGRSAILARTLLYTTIFLHRKISYGGEILRLQPAVDRLDEIISRHSPITVEDNLNALFDMIASTWGWEGNHLLQMGLFGLARWLDSEKTKKRLWKGPRLCFAPRDRDKLKTFRWNSPAVTQWLFASGGRTQERRVIEVAKCLKDHYWKGKRSSNGQSEELEL